MKQHLCAKKEGITAFFFYGLNVCLNRQMSASHKPREALGWANEVRNTLALAIGSL